MASRQLYMLDTNILVYLVRGGVVGTRIRDNYNLGELKCMPLISIVSQAELLVFARRNNWGIKKMYAVQKILDNSIIIDITKTEIVNAYVELDIFLKTICKPAIKIDQNDIWIAASAKATDSILITADKHFKHFPIDLLKYEYIDAKSGIRA